MFTAEIVSPNGGCQYYYEKDSIAADTRWQGEGAEQLDLEGQVKKGVFHKMMHGTTWEGAKLRVRRKEKGKTERAAFDLQFSVPKGVSIAARIFDQPAILQASQESVNAALKRIEKDHLVCKVRKNKKTTYEKVKMIAAVFTHSTNRNDGVQHHEHCIVMNAGLCSDGKYRSLSNDHIFGKHKVKIGLDYIRDLRQRLEAMGCVCRTTHKDQWELESFPMVIKGKVEQVPIPQELIDEFSTRRKEVLNAATGSSRKSRRFAALKTRKPKVMRDSLELKQWWAERVEAVARDIQQKAGQRRSRTLKGARL